MMQKEFYTYILLDPRKPGSYSYGDYTFEFEPFYVGKGGLEDRYARHLSESKDIRNHNHKHKKIRKICKENLYPLEVKIKENISEQEALNLEIWLIWAIGRNDEVLGPLTNHTYGGEGVSGYKHSEESKKKNSERNKGCNSPNFGKLVSKETRLKLSNINKGHGVSKETREKISKSNKGKFHTEETKYVWSLLRFGHHVSKETREKISKSNKGKFHTEETKKRMSESKLGNKNYWFGKHRISPMKDKYHTEESKLKMSISQSGESHPMYGKHHTEESKRKNSESNKGKVLSVEHKMKISESAKKRILTDETKLKISETKKRKFEDRKNHEN